MRLVASTACTSTSVCGAVVEFSSPDGSGIVRGKCPDCGETVTGSVMTYEAGSDGFQRWRRPSRRAVNTDRASDNAKILAKWSLPLYGLDDSWAGRRWIGRHG